MGRLTEELFFRSRLGNEIQRDPQRFDIAQVLSFLRWKGLAHFFIQGFPSTANPKLAFQARALDLRPVRFIKNGYRKNLNRISKQRDVSCNY